jgi:hypothetical protein
MIVSYAIVRDDPPELFLADDVETLQWVLALQLVAQTRPQDLPAHAVGPIRDALAAQRWGDAVVAWIDATGRIVDVYPSEKVHEVRDVELGAEELQFTPLFRDGL